jgi:hypothetical protein
VAASPTQLYLMTSNNAKGIILAKHLVLLNTLDRENLTVEMHQRATFEIERANVGPAKAIAPLMLLVVLLGINWGDFGVTGTVIVGMALHAMWDFGTFTHSGDAGAATTAEPTLSKTGPGFAMALSVICVVLFIVSAKRLFATDAAPSENTTPAVQSFPSRLVAAYARASPV